APIKLDLKEVDGSKCDPAKLQELLQKLEFRSLARQLPLIMQVPESSQPAHLPASVTVGKDVYINTEQKLETLPLKKVEQLYIHSFSAGKHGKDPLVIALSTDGKTTYIVDVATLGA